MFTKIPDCILEKLYCDDCYKFLSVKPVKVFPGKKIKCGRCCNNGEDDGVVSLYQLIADQYHFPCVNRYDGCDILLTPSEVVSHEKNCESRQYVCPICQDDERIPTFLMIKHYRERHKGALLNTPVFCLDPRESLQVEKKFLYKLDNMLFFINCFLTESEDAVSLNARYLGVLNESEIITQKFILRHGNVTIREETLCLPYHKTHNMGLSVSMVSFNQRELITVCFEINISSRVILSEIPLTVQAQCDSMTVPAQQATVLRENIRPYMNASLIDVGWCHAEDELVKLRMINPKNYVQNTFQPSSKLDHIINKSTKEKLFLHCFKCKELAYSVAEYPYGRKTLISFVKTITSNNETFLICKSCYNYTNALGLLGSYKITDDYFTETYLAFQLLCIWDWNCAVVSIAGVRTHEILCDKQPSRLCPVESCLMKGKLFELKVHFEEHSPEYSLLFESSVDLQLSLSKPVMKQFLLVRNNVFVYVELTWTKNMWHMEFRLCGNRDTFAGMKLKAMVFDTSSGTTFLGLAEQPQILKFRHVETVLIKCFLEYKSVHYQHVIKNVAETYFKHN